MFCSECGAKLGSLDRTCSACGARVEQDEDVNVPAYHKTGFGVLGLTRTVLRSLSEGQIIRSSIAIVLQVAAALVLVAGLFSVPIGHRNNRGTLCRCLDSSCDLRRFSNLLVSGAINPRTGRLSFYCCSDSFNPLSHYRRNLRRGRYRCWRGWLYFHLAQRAEPSVAAFGHR